MTLGIMKPFNNVTVLRKMILSITALRIMKLAVVVNIRLSFVFLNKNYIFLEIS